MVSLLEPPNALRPEVPDAVNRDEGTGSLTLGPLSHPGELEAIWVQVVLALVDASADLQARAATAATELAENAFFHGGAPGTGGIEMTREGDMLRIVATSTVGEPADMDRLEQTLNRIRRAPDLESLYADRLEAFTGDAFEDTAGLGLLRVAFECGFAISHAIEGETLKVIALRPFAD